MNTGGEAHQVRQGGSGARPPAAGQAGEDPGMSAGKRPVTPGTLLAALSVPVMTVLGVASALHSEDIQDDWSFRQQSACRHMPFPMTEYLAAWGGVALGVAAVIVGVLTVTRLRRRHGTRLGGRWPALLVSVGVQLFMWLNVLAIPMESITLYETYSNAGSPVVLGDCA
ncbi:MULTISPECIES: hypothetical protein [Streptomyces]|uniref:hypothetical protein n=1 Tax=Streptomyces TaxID=1883 RepID=UPI00163BBA74|nr:MULTISPECIES: hypothetical protein [Streptomyces]MBC2878742.1 hypothetical protein [Streptomyces sp. TYQ1024]UBI35184.1 hypothetical protein K7I03_01080 [Streptomyces mobaraensis]UKW27776.1 hypothetical protein MCU78_01120 [Streptomyces sp. TYQ1024]